MQSMQINSNYRAKVLRDWKFFPYKELFKFLVHYHEDCVAAKRFQIFPKQQQYSHSEKCILAENFSGSNSTTTIISDYDYDFWLWFCYLYNLTTLRE